MNGYEYVKLQGEIYLLTGSGLEGSVNFGFLNHVFIFIVC